MAIDLDRALKALGEHEALVGRTRTVLEALRDGEQQVGSLRKQVADLTANREALRRALAEEEAHLATQAGEAEVRHRSAMAKLDEALAARTAELGTAQNNLRLAQERLAAIERQADETAQTRRKALDKEVGDLERAGRGRIAALAEQEGDLLTRVHAAERRLAKIELAENEVRSRAAAIARK